MKPPHRALRSIKPHGPYVEIEVESPVGGDWSSRDFNLVRIGALSSPPTWSFRLLDSVTHSLRFIEVARDQSPAARVTALRDLPVTKVDTSATIVQAF